MLEGYQGDGDEDEDLRPPANFDMPPGVEDHISETVRFGKTKLIQPNVLTSLPHTLTSHFPTPSRSKIKTCNHVGPYDSMGAYDQPSLQISHNKHLLRTINRPFIRRDPRCRDGSREKTSNIKTSYPGKPCQPCHYIPQSPISQSYAAPARLGISF